MSNEPRERQGGNGTPPPAGTQEGVPGWKLEAARYLEQQARAKLDRRNARTQFARANLRDARFSIPRVRLRGGTPDEVNLGNMVTYAQDALGEAVWRMHLAEGPKARRNIQNEINRLRLATTSAARWTADRTKYVPPVTIPGQRKRKGYDVAAQYEVDTIDTEWLLKYLRRWVPRKLTWDSTKAPFAVRISVAAEKLAFQRKPAPGWAGTVQKLRAVAWAIAQEASEEDLTQEEHESNQRAIAWGRLFLGNAEAHWAPVEVPDADINKLFPGSPG